MKSDRPRQDNLTSTKRPGSRLDAFLALRLSFALLVPSLVLAWSLLGVGGRQVSVTSPVPAPLSAGQDAPTLTPTIEVYDPNKAEASTPTPIPQDERAALFDGVWSAVEQNYIDPDFNGVDWEGLREKYRREAIEAPDSPGVYRAIVQMVASLNDGRSTFTPPRNVQMTPDEASSEFANIGITRVYDKNSLLVQYVYPNSPAAEAGIKRRDRITAIDGKPVTEETRDGSALAGIVDSKVSITVRSPGGQTRDMILTRKVVVGPVPLFSRQLAEDPTVVYLGMPSMGVANVDRVSIYMLTKLYRQYLVQDVPLKGLIIDLRHSRGSALLTLTVLLGEVTEGALGRFEARDAANTVDLDAPQGPLFDKYSGVPLVLLVDGGTQGDAEIMAAALQAQGRARIVGTRTAGNTISNETYAWGDGSVLSIPQWRYFLPDGSNIDGRGVTPDLEVAEDWTEHPEGSDPYIDAAVSLLHSMDSPQK